MPTASKLTIHYQLGNGDATIQRIYDAEPQAVAFFGGYGDASLLPNTPYRIGITDNPQDAQKQRSRGLTPEAAAAEFVGWHEATYAANPDITHWTGHNEPGWGTADEMAWYAAFEAERCKLMASKGYRCAIGGFATGTPKLALWPHFLSAVQEAIRRGGILHLHEYSAPWVWWMTGAYQRANYDTNGNWLGVNEMCGTQDYPCGWTTLRYRQVYDKYLKPANAVIPLVITECGTDIVGPRPATWPVGPWRDDNLQTFWEQHDGRGDAEAYYMEQLAWYDSELRKDSYVVGACVFTWGSPTAWRKYDVANTAVAGLLADHLEQTQDEVEPPPPPPADCRGLPRVQYRREYRVVPGDATEAQRLELYRQAAVEQVTVGPSFDDSGLGDLDDKTAVLYLHPDERQQEYLDWFGEHYPGTRVEFRARPGDDPPPPPPPGMFRFEVWPTEYEKVNQWFGENPDWYDDFGLPGHDGVDIRAYSGSKIFAVAPGTVYRVEHNPDAHNYGIHVRIEHRGGYRTIYAHLQEAHVNEGESVAAGQVIGLADNTGNSFGSHLHLGMKHPDGQDGWPYNLIDPGPYLLALLETDVPPSTEYSGPPVTAFVRGIDQPASDWYWPSAKSVFDVTALSPKFHAGGDNYKWYIEYKDDQFNIVRILLDPTFAGGASAIVNETRANVQRFYDMGVRDFICWNEPNIEGMGVRWDSGGSFGKILNDAATFYRNEFPQIRLWFPGCSPQWGAQHEFINAARAAGAFTQMYGVTEHVYTGIVGDKDAAVAQMVGEVKDFQRRHALDRPLVIGEFSVNEPAPADYKARVYRRFYQVLDGIEGVQAAYSFTSSWNPSPDANQEGWLEHGIDDAYVRL